MLFNKLLIFFQSICGSFIYRPMCVIVLITHMKKDTNVSDSHFNIQEIKKKSQK